MRDWELVLYKYANFSVMESECPDGSGPHRPTPAGVFPSAGSIPPGHSNFCLFSLSLDASFFSIFHPPRFYFSFYRVVTQKLGSFSLFYNNSGHYPEVILVCISFMPVFSRPACSVVLKALKFSPFVVHRGSTLHPQSELLALSRK